MTAIATYADTVNQQFFKSQSQYVDLNQRLQSTIKNDRYKFAMVQDSMAEFTRRHSNTNKWSDILLCQSILAPLDKIVIDITLQRQLDIPHAISILDNFQPIRVMPIQVYEDALMPDKYVCWDGQHTAIVLYLISLILKEDSSKCLIPINLYRSNLKSEMRVNFMELNGEAKKPLEAIDKFHQMVYGVRTDGSTNPDWLLAEKKQQALESAKMFATHIKFGDNDQPGALTRLDELMDKKYELEVTQHFCEYFYTFCRSNRPVQPKECWLFYSFFKQCLYEGIEVDHEYIEGVAESMNTAFNNNFDAIEFMQRANQAFRAHYEKVNHTALGIRYPEKPIGLTFLISQIQKNFSKVCPFGPRHWPVQSSYLF